MCVYIFSITLVWNISHFNKNLARYNQKCMLDFTWSIRYSCQVLIKLEFPRQIFDNFSNIDFHDRPVRAELFHLDRQTGRRADKHDEYNSRF
jgi:hypothetical protein